MAVRSPISVGIGPARTKDAFFTIGRLVYHQANQLRIATNQSADFCGGSTSSTALCPSELHLTLHLFPSIGWIVYHSADDGGRWRTRKLAQRCSAFCHGIEESKLTWNSACQHRKRILHGLVDSFTGTIHCTINCTIKSFVNGTIF